MPGTLRRRPPGKPTVAAAVASLLVTNDFPPKLGGIQSYLWELWRRLPAGRATVLTTPHAGAAAFDASAPLRVTRTAEPVLLPHPLLGARIRRQARLDGATLVVLDPALPLGWLGPVQHQGVGQAEPAGSRGRVEPAGSGGTGESGADPAEGQGRVEHDQGGAVEAGLVG